MANQRQASVVLNFESWPLPPSGPSRRFTREDSLARLYAPAIAFERLSINLDSSSVRDASQATPIRTRPRSMLFPLSQGTSPRPSTKLQPSTDPVARDFGLNHNSSVRRKPVPKVIDAPTEASTTASDKDFPVIGTSDASYLLQAGNAAQAKRKKRRVSVAFSEILAGLGDRKEGDCVGGGDQEGEDDEVKPRRIKRLKSRLSGWFGGTRKET